ncbi:ATP synthase subunit delta, mitochondrial-like [Rhopilema esculentum]|uniref:ATP synthase subunit delta, mitochondrial-like n=1 Tax=Rhopilema esculentum TaxID=499914 RepID=UPI0031CF95E9|eukprot:gene4547-20799_t
MSFAAIRNVCRVQGSSKLLRLALVKRGYADEAVSGGLSLTFGTPHKVFFNEQGVSQVDVPSLTGSFGILPSHVPIISVLKPGVVTVYSGGSTEKFFVSSGTITVNKDSSAQILAEEAAPLSDLDVHAARQGLEASQTLLSTASTDVDKAKAIVGIEFHEALIKALE